MGHSMAIIWGLTPDLDFFSCGHTNLVSKSDHFCDPTLTECMWFLCGAVMWSCAIRSEELCSSLMLHLRHGVTNSPQVRIRNIHMSLGTIWHAANFSTFFEHLKRFDTLW